MKYITEEEFMQYMDILKETFSRIEKRMDERFDRVEEQFVELRDEIKYLNIRVGRIEKNIVHKSQFNSLLIILEKKEVISSFDKSHVLFKQSE
jgi:hypothetical protein